MLSAFLVLIENSYRHGQHLSNFDCGPAHVDDDGKEGEIDHDDADIADENDDDGSGPDETHG